MEFPQDTSCDALERARARVLRDASVVTPEFVQSVLRAQPPRLALYYVDAVDKRQCREAEATLRAQVDLLETCLAVFPTDSLTSSLQFSVAFMMRSSGDVARAVMRLPDVWQCVRRHVYPELAQYLEWCCRDSLRVVVPVLLEEGMPETETVLSRFLSRLVRLERPHACLDLLHLGVSVPHHQQEQSLLQLLSRFVATEAVPLYRLLLDTVPGMNDDVALLCASYLCTSERAMRLLIVTADDTDDTTVSQHRRSEHVHRPITLGRNSLESVGIALHGVYSSGRSVALQTLEHVANVPVESEAGFGPPERQTEKLRQHLSGTLSAAAGHTIAALRVDDPDDAGHREYLCVQAELHYLVSLPRIGVDWSGLHTVLQVVWEKSGTFVLECRKLDANADALLALSQTTGRLLPTITRMVTRPSYAMLDRVRLTTLPQCPIVSISDINASRVNQRAGIPMAIGAVAADATSQRQQPVALWHLVPSDRFDRLPEVVELLRMVDAFLQTHDDVVELYVVLNRVDALERRLRDTCRAPLQAYIDTDCAGDTETSVDISVAHHDSHVEETLRQMANYLHRECISVPHVHYVSASLLHDSEALFLLNRTLHDLALRQHNRFC